MSTIQIQQNHPTGIDLTKLTIAEEKYGVATDVTESNPFLNRYQNYQFSF